MEKTSKASREASDCKSPSWPRKALPTLHSSHPPPKGKRVTVRATSSCYYHTSHFSSTFQPSSFSLINLFNLPLTLPITIKTYHTYVIIIIIISISACHLSKREKLFVQVIVKQKVIDRSIKNGKDFSS